LEIIHATNTCEHYKLTGVAAKYGQLACLRYLHQQGYPWNNDTFHNACNQAAIHGHTKCLQYAHENGCIWTEYTCWLAVYYKKIECLQYAHTNGCPFDNSLYYAVTDVILLQEVRKMGCVWNECVCKEFATKGLLSCLQYAHEHGCPWSYTTCIAAITSKHIECLIYACENKCPVNLLVYWTAMQSDDHNMIQCVSKHIEKMKE
jgi:hypothetical protein